ncbi:hypothetical protein [Phenylobacterium sp.]|uniref:hypothetical protein n=1 Tax=Phenylobacterium sp. TaxID=1871053 RepID=UPI0035B46626
MTDLERALERCDSLSPEVRKIGIEMLEALYLKGCAGAAVELAHIVVSEDYICELTKLDAVRLLIRDLRLSGSSLSFQHLYHHARGYVSDELMYELLTLAAPNCMDATEILEANLPGWRHPLL